MQFSELSFHDEGVHGSTVRYHGAFCLFGRLPTSRLVKMADAAEVMSCWWVQMHVEASILLELLLEIESHSLINHDFPDVCLAISLFSAIPIVCLLSTVVNIGNYEAENE